MLFITVSQEIGIILHKQNKVSSPQRHSIGTCLGLVMEWQCAMVTGSREGESIQISPKTSKDRVTMTLSNIVVVDAVSVGFVLDNDSLCQHRGHSLPPYSFLIFSLFIFIIYGTLLHKNIFHHGYSIHWVIPLSKSFSSIAKWPSRRDSF